MNRLKIDISGIKCDNKNCDYRNEDVKCEDYESWIDKPCPKCGRILLTIEDYKAVKKMMRFGNIFAPLLKDGEGEPKIRVELDMDGSGSLKIKE